MIQIQVRSRVNYIHHYLDLLGPGDPHNPTNLWVGSCSCKWRRYTSGRHFAVSLYWEHINSLSETLLYNLEGGWAK